jgi:hypothetical protein
MNSQMGALRYLDRGTKRPKTMGLNSALEPLLPGALRE